MNLLLKCGLRVSPRTRVAKTGGKFLSKIIGRICCTQTNVGAVMRMIIEARIVSRTGTEKVISLADIERVDGDLSNSA